MRCNLVDVNVHPLLDQKICMGMALLRVLDSDAQKNALKRIKADVSSAPLLYC